MYRLLQTLTVCIYLSYLVVLWSIVILFFVFMSGPSIIDREVAAAITNGCAFYEDVLYIKEGEFLSPALIATGNPRDFLPGFTGVPAFVTLRHYTGWFAWRDVVVYSLKSVRCVLSQMQDI